MNVKRFTQLLVPLAVKHSSVSTVNELDFNLEELCKNNIALHLVCVKRFLKVLHYVMNPSFQTDEC